MRLRTADFFFPREIGALNYCNRLEICTLEQSRVLFDGLKNVLEHLYLFIIPPTMAVRRYLSQLFACLTAVLSVCRKSGPGRFCSKCRRRRIQTFATVRAKCQKGQLRDICLTKSPESRQSCLTANVCRSTPLPATIRHCQCRQQREILVNPSLS